MISKSIRFTHCICVSGNLISNFVFQNDNELQLWKKKELPKFENKYGKLFLDESILPGLVVGNKCFVDGEGTDKFIIKSIVKYSENRYVFCLNSGCVEEVAKCRCVNKY